MTIDKFMTSLELDHHGMVSLATDLGIKIETLRDKIVERNGSEFTAKEIAHIRDRYDLSDSQIDELFFTAQIK